MIKNNEKDDLEAKQNKKMHNNHTSFPLKKIKEQMLEIHIHF